MYRLLLSTLTLFLLSAHVKSYKTKNSRIDLKINEQIFNVDTNIYSNRNGNENLNIKNQKNRNRNKFLLTKTTSSIDTNTENPLIFTIVPISLPISIDTTIDTFTNGSNGITDITNATTSTDITTTSTSTDTTSTSTSSTPTPPISALITIPPLGNKGYIVLLLLFLVTTLCALDRVAMSVAILPMGQEFQYSDSTR